MSEKGGAIYQLFLLSLSVYVLVVVFAETFIISDPEIADVLQKIDLCICIVFLADFFVNLFFAENKLKYLKWGWIDFLSSIPLIDPLRWGRLARVIRILRFLRTVKSLKILLASVQKSRFQSLTLVFSLIFFVTFTVCTGLIIEFERDHIDGINASEQAIWWAFLNVMNAKVAINEAQSAGGIFITVILNKLGLLLFAYLNAMIIGWLVHRKIADK